MTTTRLTISAVALLALAACQTTDARAPEGVSVYRTSTAFDPAEAGFIHVQGTGRIKGRAYLDTPDGRQPAARSKVTLVPATAYARERVRLIYGGANMASLRRVNFPDADKRYHAFTRSTMADAQGGFAFPRIGPGEYYITTAVIWTPGGGREERASLIGSVSVSQGEEADVELAAVWN